METWGPYLALDIAGGLIPALIARGKGRNLLTWWVYGTLLPLIALPHALFAGHAPREGTP